MSSSKTVLLYPLNSPGHINSLLGIADRLKEEYGYRTVFLILGDMIGSNITDHGHELVILDEASIHEDYEILEGDELLTEEELERLGRLKKKFPGCMKWPQVFARYNKILQLEPIEAVAASAPICEKMMVGELIDNHERVAAAISQIKPDLILVDAYYIPPCIVNRTDVPWARVYSANPIAIIDSKLKDGVRPPQMCGFKLMDKGTREELRASQPEKWKSMVEEWASATRRINEAMGKAEAPLHEFMESNQCSLPPAGQQAHDSPFINFYMYPKAIDYDQDDDMFQYKPRWFRCDSLMRRSPRPLDSEKLKSWEEKLSTGMENKREMIFFSLGSLASGNVRLMKRLIDMLGEDDQRLYVVSKGVNGDQYDLNPGNMIGGNFIPQTFFLERANIAIIHGGNNSVTECLYYGLPMIVLPVFADQFDNAQRIEDLKLGKRLNPHDCTREDLKRAIEDISINTSLLERMREIGKEMRARNDARKTAAIVRKLVEEGDLELAFIEDCRNKNFEEINI